MSDGVLFLHAWPLDARMWDRQRAAVPDGVAVVAPNLPGFGGSEPAGDVMTMTAAAERALAAMDDAGIERAVVCGLSIGGYVAFELWRRARERVGGLVLANTRAVGDSDEAAAARRTLAERLRSEGNVLADDPPPLLAEDAPGELVERIRGWIADQPAEAIAAALLGMAARPDSTPDLPTIDVPTLVVTSTGDRLIAPEIAVEMGRGIPEARIETLAGAGHLSNVEAPDAFDARVLEHLDRCGLA
ncbi:MAG TPA: alpha/beta fold hydrolase [Actinomycetota bacterium]|nr:alpha/beta fold hydrolase [Actinomycetota bacterium]